MKRQRQRAAPTTLSIEQAVRLVPTLPVPTGLVLELARLLDRPRQLGKLTIEETEAMLNALQASIDEGFNRTLKTDHHVVREEGEDSGPKG